jgi:hypothetical protein
VSVNQIHGWVAAARAKCQTEEAAPAGCDAFSLRAAQRLGMRACPRVGSLKCKLSLMIPASAETKTGISHAYKRKRRRANLIFLIYADFGSGAVWRGALFVPRPGCEREARFLLLKGPPRAGLGVCALISKFDGSSWNIVSRLNC